MNKVSVVIPYYNDSPVFDRCLLSIKKQTYQPYEVIIVDDCSDDSFLLLEIVKKYSCLNIRVYRNETNKNGAYSRNLGIKLAQGDFIALLDADDYWLSNHIDLSVTGLLKTNSFFVYSNVVHEGVDGKRRIRKVSNTVHNDMFPANILLLSPPQTNSFVFKKIITEKILFDEELRRHQDFQVLLDVIISEYKSEYLDISTAIYCESHRSSTSRIHPDSIFKFWSSRVNHVDVNLLRVFLISNLLIVSKVCPDKIHEYISEYYCFKAIKSNFFFFALNKIGKRYLLARFFITFYYNFFCDYSSISIRLMRKITSFLIH